MLPCICGSKTKNGPVVTLCTTCIITALPDPAALREEAREETKNWRKGEAELKWLKGRRFRESQTTS